MAGRNRTESLFAEHDDIAERHDWRVRERRQQRLLSILGLAVVLGAGGAWWLYGPSIPAFVIQLPGGLTFPPQAESPAAMGASPVIAPTADMPVEHHEQVDLAPNQAVRPRSL